MEAPGESKSDDWGWVNTWSPGPPCSERRSRRYFNQGILVLPHICIALSFSSMLASPAPEPVQKPNLPGSEPVRPPSLQDI